MSSKIKVDTIENVAGSGNVSLGSGHNLVVPGNITGQGTAAITSNATVGGTLGVTGISTLNNRMNINFNGSATQAMHLKDTGGGNLASFGLYYNPSNTLIGNIQNANNTGIHLNVGTNGSVVFDNTGYTAANALDDYEEGDRASGSVSGITASTNTVTGYYTKVGRQVVEHIKVVISGKSGGSGNPYIGLSFTPTKSVGASLVQGGSIGMNTVISNSTFLNTGFMGVYGGNPQVYANDYQQGYYSHSNWGNGTLAFTVIYEAD